MVRASFTDGQLDSGKIASLVQSLIAKRPRNCIGIVQNYNDFFVLRSRSATRESKVRAN